LSIVARNPHAVVVGLCAHGLAIVRALSHAGVTVHALEQARHLPGVRTNCASIEFISDINGAGLIAALVALAPVVSVDGPPVLFLTNDTMVATIASNYAQVAELYRLSWASCRDQVQHLLDKSRIQERCEKAGILYPKSRLVENQCEIRRAGEQLRYPIIFKPTRPLSDYKTLLVRNEAELRSSVDTLCQGGSAIVQEYITGDESRIHFAALFYQGGEVRARYEGKKLRSRPMGHTTVAIGDCNQRLHEIARRFFSGMNISGPVSLEAKLDGDSNYWVIEPTVGRTDFWVDLCIRDNVNLPVLEYSSVSEPAPIATAQLSRTLWVNRDRDPGAVFWVILHHPRQFLTKRVADVYCSLRDPRPLLKWTLDYFIAVPGRLWSKLGRMLHLRSRER
jgi:D-aspartate ligase